MKKGLLFIALALVSLLGSAQVYEEGGINANLGIGLGLAYGAGDATLPPLSVAVDYGLTPNISLGGYIGYAGAKEELLDYTWKYNYTIIGARGAYHLDRSDDLDLYGGVMLAYVVGSVKFESDNEALEAFVVEPTVGGVGFSAFVGGRYMFSEKVGAFGEMGYGISWLTVGLTSKF